MSEELKPCPFCEKEAELKRDPTYVYYIICKECGVMTNISSRKSSVISLWNTRSIENRLNEAIEDLKMTIEAWRDYV